MKQASFKLLLFLIFPYLKILLSCSALHVLENIFPSKFSLLHPNLHVNKYLLRCWYCSSMVQSLPIMQGGPYMTATITPTPENE